jgi:hypothetical protein
MRAVTHFSFSMIDSVFNPCFIYGRAKIISSYQDALILYLHIGKLSVTLPPVNFPETDAG